MVKKKLGTTPVVEYLSSMGGPVAYDATGAGNTASPNNTAGSLSWSHSVGTIGPTTVVMVGFNAYTSSPTTVTATYGGVSMTLLQSQTFNNLFSGCSYIFYIFNPTSGSQTVSVSWSGAATVTSVAGNSVSYTNVQSMGAVYTNYGASGGPSLAVSASASGERIFQIFGQVSSAAETSYSQTSRYSSVVGTTLSNIIGDAAGTGSAVSFTATNASGAAYAAIAVRLTASVGTVPPGVSGMWLSMVGAGGGGGSGRRGASATARYGGEGGQGGYAMYDVYIPVALLGSTYTVTVPSTGGTGGLAQTTNTTNGNAGGNGGSTIFASGSQSWTCMGGAGGQGGGTADQTTSQYDPTVSRGRLLGGYGGFGGTGGTGTLATAGSAGDWCGAGAGGGGGGGGISSANVAGNGGNGGVALTLFYTQGIGGVANGASPTSGAATPIGFSGSGSGGGAAVSASAGQSGANAVGYGGGGGGGAGSLNGNNSGAGGNGAPGYARIVWDYKGDRKNLGTAPWADYKDTTSLSGLTVPNGIRGLWIYMIGPGGGGGSGSTAATTASTYGGAGGNGGMVVKRWISASVLGSTYSVSIPSRRTGGTAISTSNGTGNSGQAFASCEFTSGTFTIWCDGGLPGAGGSSTIASWPGINTAEFYSSTAQGGAGAPSGFSFSPTDGTVAGGLPNTYRVDDDANGWQDFGAPGGGGAGGNFTSSVFLAGSEGGFSRAYGQPGGGIGNGVVAPGSGSPAIPMVPGGGAGGGAAQKTANAQAGADATGYGGGGGGGGAAVNGFTSGAGGKGGPGYIRIIWDYI